MRIKHEWISHFSFFFSLLLQKLFPNFFLSQRRYCGSLKKRECLSFFFPFLLSFFLFVYIGREYTCIYVDMRIAFRLVWHRADMLILQLWVDRIVWERCPCCNMRWWSKTCAEMEDFCMKLRPFDRVMAVNRLFSSLLFRRVCFLLPSFSSFLLLLLFFLHFSLSLRLLPFYRKFARESRSCYALDAFLLLFCFLSRFAFFSFVFSLFTFLLQWCSFAESSHRLSIVVPVSPNFRFVVFPVLYCTVCVMPGDSCFLCLHEPVLQIVPRGRALIFKKSSVKNYKKTVVFVV